MDLSGDVRSGRILKEVELPDNGPVVSLLVEVLASLILVKDDCHLSWRLLLG